MTLTLIVLVQSRHSYHSCGTACRYCSAAKTRPAQVSRLNEVCRQPLQLPLDFPSQENTHMRNDSLLVHGIK